MRVSRKLCIAVEVRAISASGSGIADIADGRVAFIPRSVPGDHLEVVVTKKKKRYVEARLTQIRVKGPSRAVPACKLYSVCGGCQLQHLNYESQLKYKATKVSESLSRIGGVTLEEPPEVIASPLQLRYRTRVTWTLRRLGGYKGFTVAGLHKLQNPSHVLDVNQECLLPDQRLSDSWSLLRSSWGGNHARLLPQGGRLQLTLRLAPRGVELVVRGGHPGWDARELHAATQFCAIWHVPKVRDARGQQQEALVAGDADENSAGGGATFEQVNPDAAQLLHEHVMQVCGEAPPGGSSAVDAYCGTGRYGRALAERGWRVAGVESHALSCEAAARGAPAGFTVRRGLVEERLAALLVRQEEEEEEAPQLLLVNPPRAGLTARVLGAIEQSGPASLVYISCDPATLARDLKALSGRYRVDSAKCFDLFPQTSHVESVVKLSSVNKDKD